MRLTRSPPDYNWVTWPILLRLYQRVITEDVPITFVPQKPGPTQPDALLDRRCWMPGNAGAPRTTAAEAATTRVDDQ